MKVYHLVVQRKRKYTSVPEVYASADEYTMDENPAYMDEQIREVIDLLGTEDETNKEFVAYGIVIMELPDSAVEQALNNWVEVPDRA